MTGFREIMPETGRIFHFQFMQKLLSGDLELSVSKSSFQAV